MSNPQIIVYILIIVTTVVSYRGFQSSQFFQAYEFEVDKIRLYKDYKRLLTSGFLHVSWLHLIMNMLCLFLFSEVITLSLGALNFIVIYLASLVGGNLLSLWVHRLSGDYSSVGASGAICGVMFASIALYPGMGIGIFFIPISIPNWLFGIAFVLYSIYGIRSRRRNIGHDAHLGGALVGMIVAIIMEPQALIENYIPILVIMVPTVVFIYLIITRPHLLLVDNLFYKKHKDYYSIDHKYNAEQHNRQDEIDRILDKISKKGMRSLTDKEKATLKEYSKKV